MAKHRSKIVYYGGAGYGRPLGGSDEKAVPKTRRSRLYKGAAQPESRSRRRTARSLHRYAKRALYRKHRKDIVAGFNEAQRIMEEEGYGNR
jgi:hypothetical protein